MAFLNWYYRIAYNSIVENVVTTIFQDYVVFIELFYKLF